MAKLPEHGHCDNCGDPVPFGERFCDEDCSGEYNNDIREAKRLDNRFYLFMAVGIGAAIAAAYIVKAFLL